MPLLPIDLQTMFAQMNQVGKAQAVQKDSSPHAQLVQGAEMAQKAKAGDGVVPEAHDVGDGLEKVKEEKQRTKNETSREKKEKEKSAEEKKQVFEDPDLGLHINIIG
ncbi:MAG TPA: hypothetical protein ENI27_06075 [bacterium]|nr:hypothetical protein [bacterium]